MINVKKYKKSKSKRVKKNRNSRLQVLAAIIFLFAGALFYRLISLQVVDHDFYVALASEQHNVEKHLQPQRGRIFISDNQENKKKELYPLATNKDFAFVYAVPKKIKDASRVAEELYKIFDQTKVEEAVEELLRNDVFFAILFVDKKSDSNNNNEETKLSPEEIIKRQELMTIKREAEINLRKEEKIKKYLQKLNKPGDPYEPIKRKVDEDTLQKVLAINSDGLDYFYEKHRYYPEKDYGSHLVGFVGFKEDQEAGRYGLEGFFDEELSGRAGSIKVERAAGGAPIIINDRKLQSAQDGSDLILTIDRSIQYMVCKRLEESALRHGADGGTVIVMHPETGAILAMCSWPYYDPNNYSEVDSVNTYNNPAIFDAYEPGSIFKSITLASSIDIGKISPHTKYRDEGFLMIDGWDKPIKNSDYDSHGGYGIVDMTTVLEKSLNTGSIFAMKKMGAENFAKYVKKFGFGEKTGIELETEGLSNIVNLLRHRIRPVEAATASFGQGITATPLQLIDAYAVIANGGILMKPYLVSEIITPNGDSSKTQPQQIRRVISERSALLTAGMLVNVVDGGHAKRAGVDGYYVAGKTGTAQVANKGGYGQKTIHTFVGFAPVEEPKFVMLVKLDDPKDVQYSASSAAPLFGELAKFILNYYQVEKER